MITKEQFLAYEAVRQSGVTNMWDTDNVISLASRRDVNLTTEECLEIMGDYGELYDKYVGKKE